jgi:hypothetical protein
VRVVSVCVVLCHSQKKNQRIYLSTIPGEACCSILCSLDNLNEDTTTGASQTRESGQSLLPSRERSQNFDV